MTLDQIVAMPWFQTLPQDECIGWTNVSQTQLSIARHSGGCTVNGKHYTYNPVADELVRSDILKRAAKWQRETKRAAAQANKAKQADLC